MRNCFHFFHDCFDVILQADKLNVRIRHDDEAASGVAVTRLADRANVDDRLLVRQLELVIEFVGTVKVRPFKKYARHMRVTDKAERSNRSKMLTNFPGLA